MMYFLEFFSSTFYCVFSDLDKTKPMLWSILVGENRYLLGKERTGKLPNIEASY
jgi:hypothetical protein